jgi:hypothetical protein
MDKTELIHSLKWWQRYNRRLSADSLNDLKLNEDELINFKYLQAVYGLNTFFGYHIKPQGEFRADNEQICAKIIEQGGDIRAMHEAGAGALYCALLSDPYTDKDMALKTVDRHIPF